MAGRSDPNGSPVSGSTPLTSRRNSSTSWESSESIRSSRRDSRTVRSTKIDTAIVAASSTRAPMRTRARADDSGRASPARSPVRSGPISRRPRRRRPRRRRRSRRPRRPRRPRRSRRPRRRRRSRRRLRRRLRGVGVVVPAPQAVVTKGVVAGAGVGGWRSAGARVPAPQSLVEEVAVVAAPRSQWVPAPRSRSPWALPAACAVAVGVASARRSGTGRTSIESSERGGVGGVCVLVGSSTTGAGSGGASSPAAQSMAPAVVAATISATAISSAARKAPFTLESSSGSDWRQLLSRT